MPPNILIAQSFQAPNCSRQPQGIGCHRFQPERKAGASGRPARNEMYYALGIDPDMEIRNRLNQPCELVKGKIVTDLFA